MAHILSVDIGTSSVKGLVFDTDQSSIVAVAAQEYPIHNPQPDYAEQDPDDWWRASINVIRQITPGLEIAAIGLTGQMHGLTLLDSDKQPVYPSIMWADQRTASLIPVLIEKVGAERFASIAGTLPAAGFMVATLVWLAENQPELLEKSRHAVLPKDYVRLKLTREVSSDHSDAAATGLFDIKRSAWSDEIISILDLPGHILPPTLPSTQVSGYLTQSAAELLGLKAGIPVVAGCADQPAQAVANGLIKPGQAAVTVGTGGQVCIPVNTTRTDPRVHVFNHAVPDMWYILGAILAAGVCLRWLRNLVGLEHTPDAYTLLAAEAAQVVPGADGLIFLPYLFGERTPLMDPQARGGFIGLKYHHSRGHMARAVMEGVVFALRQALETSLMLTNGVETIIAAGGASESLVWMQLQADIYGRSLQKTALKEQTCIGAALLAGVGAGIYGSIEQASATVTRYGAVTEPNPANREPYDALYQQFTDLYPRLKDDFHRLSR